MRSFVACSSVFLMAWLAWAYVHDPLARGVADPASAEVDEATASVGEEAGDLTVSVSPSDVTPD